jgi:hypothetical protein
MRIEIVNETSSPSRLVLEPWGEIYELLMAVPVTVEYLGDEAKGISVRINDQQTEVWALGDGVLHIVASAQ